MQERSPWHHLRVSDTRKVSGETQRRAAVAEVAGEVPWRQIDEHTCLLFTRATEAAAKRWSPGVLLALARGATRFSEVAAAVPGISDRMLALRLREMVSAQLVEREVVPTTPVLVRYRLTARGQELMAALRPLVHYGVRWSEDGTAPTP